MSSISAVSSTSWLVAPGCTARSAPGWIRAAATLSRLTSGITGLPPSTDSAPSSAGSTPADGRDGALDAVGVRLVDGAGLGGHRGQRELDLEQRGDPRGLVEQAGDPVGAEERVEQLHGAEPRRTDATRMDAC